MILLSLYILAISGTCEIKIYSYTLIALNYSYINFMEKFKEIIRIIVDFIVTILEAIGALLEAIPAQLLPFILG